MTSTAQADPVNHDVATYLGEASARANPEAEKLAAYPLFDWLRFILASTVVLGHSAVPLPGPISAGLAVDVFLALSGWLIGGILLKSERADMPRFFFNRATRIWTPYFATVGALYLVAALRQGIDQNWFKYLFYDVTFTHYTFTTFPRASFEMPLKATGNHFWSISVEEQFYLVAPLLMLAGRWGKSLPVWVAVAAILLGMDSRFAAIALGVCAAVLQRDYRIVDGGLQRRLAFLAVAGIALAVLWHWDVQRLRSIFSVAMVLATAIPGPREPIGVFFGAISYPLYLNQWMGGYLVHPLVKRGLLPLPHWGVQLADYLVGVAIAAGAWFVIDRNVMRWRGDWYTPALGRRLAMIAYTLCAIGLVGGLALRVAGY